MYWKGYTREAAAQSLLDIIQRLSGKAYIFRPIDIRLKRQARLDLVEIVKELPGLGYESDSSTFLSLSSVLSTFDAIPTLEPLPVSVAIDITQVLLGVVKSLSSSSHFPVPNRHLPVEILRLIQDYVLLEECGITRQQTVAALSATSVLWHQLASERQVFYIHSIDMLRRWFMCHQEVRSGCWEEVEVDIAEENHVAFDGSEIRGMMNKEPGREGYWGYKGPARGCRFIVNLDAARDELSPEHGSWAESISYLIENRPFFSVRLPVWDEDDYHRSWYIFENLEEIKVQEAELYLGNSEKPILLTTATIQRILIEIYHNKKDTRKVDEIIPYPIFTSYTVLVLPWIVFTAPQFLLQTVQAVAKGSLSPSRLRHLEISFEVDPSNPAQAIKHLESFFSAISPKLETLVFRLRVTSPHPSSADAATFTRSLVTSLGSCRHLRHLEIGGFGFSPDILTHLTALPLSTLVLLPLQHCKTLNDLLPLFTPDSTLLKTLKRCSVHIRKKFFGSSRNRQHRDGEIDLRKLGQKLDIYIWEGHLDGEVALLKDLMEGAGVV